MFVCVDVIDRPPPPLVCGMFLSTSNPDQRTCACGECAVFCCFLLLRCVLSYPVFFLLNRLLSSHYAVHTFPHCTTHTPAHYTH